MDTNFLQSFVSVIECGSVAEAARRLDLSPATVASRLKTLEEEVGTPLVQRTGRTVKATEAGMRVLSLSREVVQSVRNLHAMANDDASVGEFRLGASPSALSGVVAPLLSALYRRNPTLSVFIEPGNSAALYPKVASGMLDAAVIVEPQFSLPKTCRWGVLVNEPLCVLAPLSMAGRDPFELLRTEPFIRYDRNMWGGRLADNYLRDHQIQPLERIEIDGLHAIAAFVHQGLGVSLVPDWTPPWSEGLRVVRIALPPPVPVRRMGLLWNNGSNKALSARLLEEAKALF
jgi:DNA-binding transcriptional LysR family regulator